MTRVEASIVGIVEKILVSVGEEVQPGQEVIVLESMKMLIPVEATIAGKVTSIHVKDMDYVNEGDTLLVLEEQQ